MEKQVYEAPSIVYEGNLEIQAGSPLGGIKFGDFEDFDEFEF